MDNEVVTGSLAEKHKAHPGCHAYIITAGALGDVQRRGEVTPREYLIHDSSKARTRALEMASLGLPVAIREVRGSFTARGQDGREIAAEHIPPTKQQGENE